MKPSSRPSAVRVEPESEIPELPIDAAAVLLRILRKEHDRAVTAGRIEAA